MPIDLINASPVVPSPRSPLRITFQISAVTAVLMSIAAGLAYPFIQPVIPIFYTLALPSNQLAPKIWLFLFPIFSWVIVLVHFSLLKLLKTLEISIEKLFAWTTVGIIGIIAVLFIRLILLVV